MIREARKILFGVSRGFQPGPQKKAENLNISDLKLIENKDADQLCSYYTADLHLCFRVG